jgi:hypothetical protein
MFARSRKVFSAAASTLSLDFPHGKMFLHNMTFVVLATHYAIHIFSVGRFWFAKYKEKAGKLYFSICFLLYGATLIKSSYIRKFRVEQLQSRI